jgi:hypothetical protein
MNLREGIKRALVVASAVYWLGAAAVAYDAYASGVKEVQSDFKGGYVFQTTSGGFIGRAAPVGQSITCAQALAYVEEQLRARGRRETLVKGGCADSGATLQTLQRKHGLSNLVASLAIAAGIYVAIAGTMVALWWIVAGFRSPKARPE